MIFARSASSPHAPQERTKATVSSAGLPPASKTSGTGSPQGRLLPALDTHGVRRGHAIFAGTGPLTRLVAAVSAGHASVDKNFAASSGVARGNVEASLLHQAGARVDAVPG